MEGAVRRRGRCVLGRLRRRARAEVRIRRTDRAHPAVADARGDLGRCSRRCCSACFYVHSRTLRTRGRSFLAIVVYAAADARGLDHLRLLAAVLHATQRARRRAADARHARRDRRAAGRSARVGRGALGRFARQRRSSSQLRPAPRAEGLDPRAGLQRAAADGDRDARCAGAARLSRISKSSSSTTTPGRGCVAAGRGALHASWARASASSTSTAAGLQGRRAELRARAHRAGRRDRRRDRQRLPGRARLAARLVPGVRRRERRDRAGAAGLPRRRRERVQGDVLRGVPRLLPYRHGHAQRAQRDHPARHHDAGAPQRARAVGGWAEWCITEDAELGLRLFEAGYEAQLHAAQLRPRPDARHVRRLTRSSAIAGRTARCRSCAHMRARCSRSRRTR